MKQLLATSTSHTPAAPRSHLKALSLSGLPIENSVEHEVDRRRFRIRLVNPDDEQKRPAATLIVRRGYVRLDSTVTNFSRPANRIAFSLFAGETPLCTLTLGLDSPAGLNLEPSFPREIAMLRRTHHKVCEITKLAVDPLGRSKKALAALFHIAHIYGHELDGATDFVMAVNTRHAAFFMKTLGFKLFGKERSCPGSDSTAVLLRLQSDTVREHLSEDALSAGVSLLDRPLYRYYFATAEATDIRRRLEDEER